MSEGGSTVVRRQLGRELRTWRERAQRTLDDVAKHAEFDHLLSD